MERDVIHVGVVIEVEVISSGCMVSRIWLLGLISVGGTTDK